MSPAYRMRGGFTILGMSSPTYCIDWFASRSSQCLTAVLFASYLYPARLSACISAMRVTVIAVYVVNTNHF
ncbi:hypothetical protein FDI67_gp12 [Escherichia phage phiKP26]|uniref:Uncharacterized protein n=1 Tax=Escherichia phage phiKP26 TaxID=2886927 RepID=M4QBL2_9CAUD|nr:hypothetical protein FDI67_gp12 [Escherichia phage phiKP26]AGH25154.1 hypothetical protein kp_12 [Escherichia phage phiKP26]